MKLNQGIVKSLVLALGVVFLTKGSLAQSGSVLYTWDSLGNPVSNIEHWIRSFGATSTSATLDNNTSGTLRIVETSSAVGGSQAFSDGFNRVRESSTASTGGTDLTGLDYLEWDLGHNGTGNVNVQFYVQASVGSTFVALGPDLAIAPGMATYQVPLTGLTADQLVYVRTMGINIRDHAALGNLEWSINEVRSGGTPLSVRDLITHNIGTPENGLQGAIVNFDGSSVLGNSGQNQTGLSHNASGSGSLQWTDVAGGAGGAISWGNGTAWNGNTFNNRTTDLSNYTRMIVRMSATDANNGGGTIGVQGFFQKNNFSFQAAGTQNLTIDGQFHDLVFSLAGLTDMNVVDLTGINLASHSQQLVINVDNIQFDTVPEPATLAVLGLGLLAARRKSRKG